MISRRHLAERNFRNYVCHNRVKKRSSFIEPIDDRERLVRRPPRRTPEQETMMTSQMKAFHRDDYDDHDDVTKKSGILKPPPPSAAESKRMGRDPQMVRDPQNQPYKSNPHESARWSASRTLRWNDEDPEPSSSSSGGRKADGMDDFAEELSELARLQEEVRKTVQSRKSLRLGSEASVTESETVVSATNGKSNLEVQSCPDIRFVVDGRGEHDRNQISVTSSEPREAAQSHRRQPPDTITQHPSRFDTRKRLLLVRSALKCNAQEEDEEVPRRVRGRSLDPYEHIPSDRRDASVPSRSRSRTTKGEDDRETFVSAGPSLCDTRDQASCTCTRCGGLGSESPDSRRERLLLQERWDANVWAELRFLLQTLTLTTTTTDGQRQPMSRSAKSSSSDEAIYGCRLRPRARIVNCIGSERGLEGAGIVGKRGGRGPGNDKMTQTEEDPCTNLRSGLQTQRKRTPSVDLRFSHLRSPGEKGESRMVDGGCQSSAADHEELDVHNCDSSITEVTSIWPSASGSGTQQDPTEIVLAAATPAAAGDCHSQEYLSLLRSISAELLTTSVSAESLRAAIGATTGGQPLDENSVLEAIDREMADVGHFVTETLDLSEIKPKEYLHIHLSKLKKFTSNLEQFISKQKPTTNLDSHVAPTAPRIV